MKAEPTAFLVEPEFMDLDLDGPKTPCQPVAASEYENLSPGAVLVTRHRGSFIRPCPATPRYNCCGLNIVHVGQGCDIGCAYCALASYLKSDGLVFFGNFPTEGLAELAKHLDREKAGLGQVPAAAEADAEGSEGTEATKVPRSHRYCTGEFTDSLLWDRPTKAAQKLVELFAEKPPFTLELKTKTDRVDHLLGLDHGGRTVISFSVNAPEVCARVEAGAASLTARLKAAKRAWKAGYRVGLHFDPLIYYSDWVSGYLKTARLIAERIPPEALALVSMGCFRYLPDLKAAVRRTRPSRLFEAEFVRGGDGKFRYPRPIRTLMYRTVLRFLEETMGPKTLVYLCMESGRVWREVFGRDPGTAGLTGMFREGGRPIHWPEAPWGT